MSNIYGERIVRIQKVMLHSSFPRFIGFNSRGDGTHGRSLTDPVVRIHTNSRAVGVGWSKLNQTTAQSIVGCELGDLFRLPDGAFSKGLSIDLLLWDLAAKLRDQPLYRLLGGRGCRFVEICDGSIYIDDLHATEKEVEDIFVKEVQTGQNYGCLNFKIKIG